jgi:N6-L-threonylcarbamoyladenine synthase
VAANPELRAAYQRKFGPRHVRVTVPPLSVCGDNAAMIALVALRLYREGRFADLSMDANPNLRLTHRD